MSQIVDDLRQVAIEIKTETQVGGNTAARVGGAFERVADALEGTQQIEDMDEAVAAVQQAAQENEQTIQDIVDSLAVVQTTGQSASDVMSQKAVTDSLVGSAIAYDNSQSGFSARNVQGALDEVGENCFIKGNVEVAPLLSLRSGINQQGQLTTDTSRACTNYLYCGGHTKICIKEPKIGTMLYGIAFYTEQSEGTFIANSFHPFSKYGGEDIYVWTVYDIPEGANYTRWTLFSQSTGKYFSPQYYFMEKISEVVSELADDVNLLNSNVSDNTQKIENLENYAVGSSINVQTENGYSIDISQQGIKVTDSNLSCSNYIALSGAKYLRYTKALFGSLKYGLAFYSYQAESTYISGIIYTEYDASNFYKIEDVEIPEGANFVRISAYASTNSRYFTPWYSLIYGSADLFKDAASSQIATQIMRSCKSISQGVLPNNLTTNYAFSATMQIVGSYAYVNYAAGNTLDGDSPTPSDVTIGCLAKISLETNEVIETLYPSVANYYDEDGNAVQGYRSNAGILMKDKNGQLGYFGQMVVPSSNNPIIAVSSFGTPESLVGNSRTMCKLQYTANDVAHNVRFSIANYRQMLVDMGYVSTYYAPVYDGYDNNCIIYDSASDKYYDLIGTVSSSGFSLPLILLESDDMHTWSLKARIGTQLWKANEIEGVIKDGKLYASIREVKTTNAISWIVYDIANNTIISSGTFNTGLVVSRPHTFIFNRAVYMVVNTSPTIYGTIINMVSFELDTRTEVSIYKMVNDVPEFMRRVSNPTGINYHYWEEIPPYTAPNKTSPMMGYGAVYCAFSEDRRLLFRRMFSQVSFGDVTALFADYNRIR